MNKRTFVILALLVALSSSATALPVVITFDAAGTVAEGNASLFVPFNMYVVGKGIGDVVGWEIAMDLNPAYVVTRTINNGPGVNLGGDDNYIIGLGNCFGTPGEDYLFISYQLVWIDSGTPVPQDDTFCLIVPDANGAEQGFLAYVNCANEVQEMDKGNKDLCGGFGDGCALINPTSPGCIIESKLSSWGSVKAAY